MAFPYKHALVIGATSGIGKGMADHFIARGLKVTAVGRRKERLEAFVSTHGPEKASSIVFDISRLSEIPAFVNKTLEEHPTIDAVFLNAGKQGLYNFADPSTIDLTKFNNEITTNFTSFVALTHAFLPHLLTHSSSSALIFTGTGLSLVPAAPFPAYSASKAALDAFIVCIRDQLRNTQIGVYHLSPGPVQTEMHDAVLGPGRGRAFGMTVSEFVDEAWSGLVRGEKDVFVGYAGGSTREQFMEIVEKRNGAIGRLSGLLRQLGM